MVDLRPVRTDKVELKASPTAGPGQRGIFATADIALKDEVIGVYTNLVQALDNTRLNDTCYNCHLWTEGQQVAGRMAEYEVVAVNKSILKVCAGCRVVRYCSKSCQKTSWASVHKLECPIFKAAPKDRVYPTSFRAILRLLLLRKAKLVNDRDWNELMTLNTNREGFQKSNQEGDSRWSDLHLMARMAHKVSGTELDLNTVLGLFERLSTNSFTLTIPTTFDTLGVALAPYAAMLNHSCIYNSVVRFMSPRGNGHTGLSIIPLRPIAAGEEITISYIDETLPYPERQRELQERYFFDCACVRCRSEAADPGLTPSQQSKYDHAVKILKAASNADNISSAAAVEQLTSALHILHATSYPEAKHPVPALRNQIILSYISAGKYGHALAHAAVQCFRTDPLLWSTAGHPLRMVHCWRLVRLMDVSSESGSGDENGDLDMDFRKYGIDWVQWPKDLLGWLLGEVQRGVGDKKEGGFGEMVRRYCEKEGVGLEGGNLKDTRRETKWYPAVERLVGDVLERERKG